MIVIADTTPLNYLVLIEQADLLPRLFGRVLIPPAVFEELKDPLTPDLVRLWLSTAPSWLQVQTLRSRPDPELDYLDEGEREAIALAEEMKADQLLLDEMDARKGDSENSVVHLLQRIRLAMQDECHGGKRGGEVEVDENLHRWQGPQYASRPQGPCSDGRSQYRQQGRCV